MLGRGEAPGGAAGGGRRRRDWGLQVAGGREAGGDLPQPAGSGDRPYHQRHHEAGECHGASPAGSGPSPPLIAPGMRRRKAGPRRPTNPPRRTPLPSSPRLPCLRGPGQRGAERRAASAVPAAAFLSAESRRGVRPLSPRQQPLRPPRRGFGGGPRPPPRNPVSGTALLFHRQPRAAPGSSATGVPAAAQLDPRTLLLSPTWGSPTSHHFLCPVAVAPLSPPTASQRALEARAKTGPGRGCAASGREGLNGPGPRLGRQSDGESPSRVCGKQREWKQMP